MSSRPSVVQVDVSILQLGGKKKKSVEKQLGEKKGWDDVFMLPQTGFYSISLRGFLQVPLSVAAQLCLSLLFYGMCLGFTDAGHMLLAPSLFWVLTFEFWFLAAGMYGYTYPPVQIHFPLRIYLECTLKQPELTKGVCRRLKTWLEDWKKVGDEKQNTQ